MKIQTKHFGEADIPEEECITFPDGFLGFEYAHDFVLLNFLEDHTDDSLLCLQCIDNQDLAFILMNPFAIVDDYAPLLSDQDLKALGATPDSCFFYYVITVIPEDFRDATVNMKCPIIINPENRLARQAILEDSTYSMRCPAIRPAQDAGQAERDGASC